MDRVKTDNYSDTQKLRILKAAEVCFRRNGFHKASMKEICEEAKMSPGSVYRYFASKEDIIEAMAEEDRKETLKIFQKVREHPNIVDGLIELTEEYLRESCQFATLLLTWEIMAEAVRNPNVKAIVNRCDNTVLESIQELLEFGKSQGQINQELDSVTFANLIFAMADGLFYRVAMNPKLDIGQLSRILTSWIEVSLLPHSSKK